MGCLLAGLMALSVQADDSVSAALRIPPAERHVIGDDIPLIWSFSNRTATPLAFLWEGCCRLNGRLFVTAEGQALPPNPPGSSLAHQFAKAERIEPGAVREFSTLLSDWVMLRSGGRYRLSGAYTGVLSNQQPQVPKSLLLWRGTAQTEDISVAVLTPEAYLAERAQREQRRGLRLELRGPPRLGPLEPSVMELTVSNLTAREQRLVWPGDVQVWILGADGLRAELSPRAVEAMTEELVLAPGGSARRSFAFTPADFERLPLGDYRCFVDLAAGDDARPRLPSNAIPLRWRLEEEDVASLLSAAARGGRTGARNAPLKLLRVYVASLRAELELIARRSLPPEELTLARQLALASCLKPHAPKPGVVDVVLRVSEQGAVEMATPALRACLGPRAGAVEALQAILEVRRHLGWEVRAVLAPGERATLADVMAVAGALGPFESQLSGPPCVRVVSGGDRTNTVMLLAQAPAAPAVLRIRPDAVGGLVVRALRTADATGAVRTNREAEVLSTEFAGDQLGELEGWVRSLGRPGLAVLLEGNGRVSWGDVARVVGSISRVVSQCDLALER